MSNRLENNPKDSKITLFYDKIKNLLRQTASMKNSNDLNNIFNEYFGEKTTSILKVISPICGGLIIGIFSKKMIKTTIILVGTSTIIYILMVSSFSIKLNLN